MKTAVSMIPKNFYVQVIGQFWEGISRGMSILWDFWTFYPRKRRAKQQAKFWEAGSFGDVTLWAAKSEENQRSVFNQNIINEKAEVLLKTHGTHVLRYAYTYLHNMEDAEDILQETLIRYLKAKPDLEDVSHERAWLLRVVGNLSKNRIDYNRVRSTDELSEQLVAEEREDLSFVWDAVKELPVKYREVIHLFYHEGYQSAEIAKILGKSDATVRSLLSRGRSKLKEILKEVYDFDESV